MSDSSGQETLDMGIVQSGALKANEEIASKPGGTSLLHETEKGTNPLGSVVLDQYTKNAILENERLYNQEMPNLLSRKGFQEKVVPEAALLMRENEPLIIAFIDMDKLKAINDSLGHSVGDASIGLLAELLNKRFARSSDMTAVQSSSSEKRRQNLARPNETGDEFLVAAPLVTEETVSKMLNEVKSEFELKAAEITKGKIIPSFSFGISRIGEEPIGTFSREDVELGKIEVGTNKNLDPETAVQKALQVAEMRMYSDKIQRKQGRE